MRKLALDLDSIDVESFDATPRAAHPEQGTIEAYAEPKPPYTDGVYPECVCEISSNCPTLDLNCAVIEG